MTSIIIKQKVQFWQTLFLIYRWRDYLTGPVTGLDRISMNVGICLNYCTLSSSCLARNRTTVSDNNLKCITFVTKFLFLGQSCILWSGLKISDTKFSCQVNVGAEDAVPVQAYTPHGLNMLRLTQSGYSWVIYNILFWMTQGLGNFITPAVANSEMLFCSHLYLSLPAFQVSQTKFCMHSSFSHACYMLNTPYPL